MDGSGGRRGSRRNDSISSIMSQTGDSPVWTRQSNDDSSAAAAAPETPRDPQRVSRASGSMSGRTRETTEHDSHMSGSTSNEQSQPRTPAPTSDEHSQPRMPVTTSDSQSQPQQQSQPQPQPQPQPTMLPSPVPVPQAEYNQASDMEIQHSVLEVLDQLPLSNEEDLVDVYQRAAVLPPITDGSLAELEVARIVSNPRLRHDVNFDKELHFRPNLDGSRGKQKIRVADDYWKALTIELELYRVFGAMLRDCPDTTGGKHNELTRMMKASQVRMPGMFETIKAILKTLVPRMDQVVIDDRLDVPMIMQQISKGVFNLMDLALWLAKLLKAHCAPMRDDWVDQMVEQTRKGVEEGCNKRIVLSLRQTLGILEAMKLDVANHQIRNLRGILIEDTVNFQQRYHISRLHQGRLDIRRSRNWFRREASHRDASVSPLEIFSSALLRSLLSQSPLSEFPETFHLDAERTRTLKHDLHNYIQLGICCDVFDQLIRDNTNEQVRDTAKKNVRAAIATIAGESRRISERSGNIAAELVRSALVLEGAEITYNSEVAEHVQRQLHRDLQLDSAEFTSRVQRIMDENVPKLFTAIEANSKLNLLALHDAMLKPFDVHTSTSPGTVSPPSLPHEDLTMQEILRRATHLGVIHWHIWSPLVYNIQDDCPVSCSAPITTSRGGSPDPGSIANDDPSPMQDVVSDGASQSTGYVGQSFRSTQSFFIRPRPNP